MQVTLSFTHTAMCYTKFYNYKTFLILVIQCNKWKTLHPDQNTRSRPMIPTPLEPNEKEGRALRIIYNYILYKLLIYKGQSNL